VEVDKWVNHDVHGEDTLLTDPEIMAQTANIHGHDLKVCTSDWLNPLGYRTIRSPFDIYGFRLASDFYQLGCDMVQTYNIEGSDIDKLLANTAKGVSPAM